MIKKNQLFKGIFVMVILLLSACSTTRRSVSHKKPEAVALAFYKKITTLDIDGAKELATEEGKEFLNLFARAIEMAEEKELEELKAESSKNVEYLKRATCNVSEEGDRATCKLCCDAKENNLDDIKLKKINGKWLVHMTKE